MTFATWWRGNSLPKLATIPTFSAQLSTDAQLFAQLTGRTQQDVETRMQNGNRLYLAYMGKIPVAYGWATSLEASISEFQFTFPVPADNSYLHNFFTFPEWRGRGIYPHLIQTIIQQEQHVERFWIGYLPWNKASERGIQKAGFHVVSDIVVTDDRITGMVLFETSERAQACADLFRLPVVTDK